MKRKKRSNHCLFRTFAIKRIGYAFSSAMYKINNTGVAKLAARPLNNTGVEKLSAFSYGGACVSACERAASFATPAELKA